MDSLLFFTPINDRETASGMEFPRYLPQAAAAVSADDSCRNRLFSGGDVAYRRSWQNPLKRRVFYLPKLKNGVVHGSRRGPKK